MARNITVGMKDTIHAGIIPLPDILLRRWKVIDDAHSLHRTFVAAGPLHFAYSGLICAGNLRTKMFLPALRFPGSRKCKHKLRRVSILTTV